MLIDKVKSVETLNKITSRKVGQILNLIESFPIPSGILMQVKQRIWDLSDEVKRDIFEIDIKQRGGEISNGLDQSKNKTHII